MSFKGWLNRLAASKTDKMIGEFVVALLSTLKSQRGFGDLDSSLFFCCGEEES
jgi:hypothetical protein